MAEEEDERLRDNDEGGSGVFDQQRQGTDEREENLDRPSQVEDVIDESEEQDEADGEQRGVVGSKLWYAVRWGVKRQS